MKIQIFFLAAFSIAATALAKLPEPPITLYGSFSHGSSDFTQPQIDGMTVAFTVSTAEASIACEGYLAVNPDTSNSYAVRLPMDDGLEPRLADTFRTGDVITGIAVVVDGAYTGSLPLSIALPNERASLVSANLSFAESLTPARFSGDFDADGLPDSWETANGFSTNYNNADEDPDGDGVNNADEYLTGTDPNQAGDTFGISSINRLGGSVIIGFGPVREGRKYVIEASALTADNWSPILTLTGLSDASTASALHTTSNTQQFYRVIVDWE